MALGPMWRKACGLTKSIRLDFWAVFLWYFLLPPKESIRKKKKDVLKISCVRFSSLRKLFAWKALAASGEEYVERLSISWL